MPGRICDFMPSPENSRLQSPDRKPWDLPRLRELYRAAVSTGGSLPSMRQMLGISPQALSQRLSLLRRLGFARTVILHDPMVVDETYLSTAWIRMVQTTSNAFDRFERDLCEDEHVRSAQRIAGDCDYRLSCSHLGYAQAAQWANALRCRVEVAEVRQVPMRQVFGHELPGVVLWERVRPFARKRFDEGPWFITKA